MYFDKNSFHTYTSFVIYLSQFLLNQPWSFSSIHVQKSKIIFLITCEFNFLLILLFMSSILCILFLIVWKNLNGHSHRTVGINSFISILIVFETPVYCALIVHHFILSRVYKLVLSYLSLGVYSWILQI